jgi:hypothetical protein
MRTLSLFLASISFMALSACGGAPPDTEGSSTDETTDTGQQPIDFNGCYSGNILFSFKCDTGTGSDYPDSPITSWCLTQSGSVVTAKFSDICPINADVQESVATLRHDVCNAGTPTEGHYTDGTLELTDESQTFLSVNIGYTDYTCTYLWQGVIERDP